MHFSRFVCPFVSEEDYSQSRRRILTKVFIGIRIETRISRLDCGSELGQALDPRILFLAYSQCLEYLYFLFTF